LEARWIGSMTLPFGLSVVAVGRKHPISSNG
jgi:hypothetical protein